MNLFTKQKQNFPIFAWSIAGLLVIGCNAANSNKKSEQDISSTSSIQLDSAKNSTLSQFWDSYNFNDTSLIHNPDHAEQRFVDFISSFPKYPINEVSASIEKMLQKAMINPTVFNFFKDQYAHYLYDPNSPMRNESYYEPVLDYLIHSPNSNSTEKIRYQMQLEMVRKNQPGSTINNFEYLQSNNKTQSLLKSKGEARLIIFYDPTCTHCQEIMGILKSSDALNKAIIQHQLQVIAIDPTGDQNRWKTYQSEIPSNWINGFDHKSNIINKQLFSIAAYPTLYLIDQNNIVLLKDPDYQLVLQLINK